MKLIECYIENFGKLSHFSHHFSDGLNIFCRENGWGKSTFSGFIKAMLYGLPASRSTDVQQNERLRYTPWQGGNFGGTLTFSVGDDTYRVERYFGQKESQDTFALYDCKTGLASTAYNAKLGEELFDIDSVGYERSTFISEKLTVDEKADYTGIQAKLVDMNDLSDYNLALKRLDKRRQHYLLTGNRGAIAETTSLLARRATELEESKEALRQTNEWSRRAKLIDKERDALEDQLRELRVASDAAIGQRVERALTAHKEQLEQNLARTREITASHRAYLSANIPTPAALEEQAKNWRVISETRAPEIPVSHIPAWLPYLLFVLAGVIAVIGVVLGAIIRPVLFAVAAVAIIPLVAGACCSFSRHHVHQTAQAVKATRAEYDRLCTSLRTFLSGYPIVMADERMKNDGERLWAIRDRVRDLETAERAENEAKAALHAFRTEHPELFTDLPRPEDDTVVKATAEAAQIREKIELLRQERAKCDQAIAAYSAAAGRYTACAQELSGLEQKKREDEKSLEIIQLTQQYLTTARTALTSRYLTDIQMHFRTYMRILTEVDQDSKFSDEYESEAYTVTSDFCVNITKFGKTRPVASLSRGGRDLVALCLRFAISDALFEGKNPPLILDDPFINLDDDKITAAMALLHRVAEKKQIFYVSCHSSRA